MITIKVARTGPLVISPEESAQVTIVDAMPVRGRGERMLHRTITPTPTTTSAAERRARRSSAGREWQREVKTRSAAR